VELAADAKTEASFVSLDRVSENRLKVRQRQVEPIFRLRVDVTPSVALRGYLQKRLSIEPFHVVYLRMIVAECGECSREHPSTRQLAITQVNSRRSVVCAEDGLVRIDQRQ
jgi:hypothetical protein